jgi:molecular chaperone GrpE
VTDISDVPAGEPAPTDQAAAAEPAAPDAASHVDAVPRAGAAQDGPLDLEGLVQSLETVMAERDSHLADLQRLQAEFANFRRQATKRQTDTIEHAASGLAGKLLPVLDACDAAVLQGAADIDPIRSALIETLSKEGLELLTDAGEAFDPERHEAVMHEEGDGGEPTVAEVMRTGYVWNGRVLRPAMVKVLG